MTRTMHLSAAAAYVALSAAIAHALPLVVPDFATDPSGAQFTIQPVAKNDPGSNNLAAAPELTFGVTSPDGTDNTLLMEWEQKPGGGQDQEAQAGWELVFGTDPDIRNQQIILSIFPPGGWTTAAGVPIVPGPGNPGIGDLFQGIRDVSVRAIDNVGALAGGWGFNTDEDLLFGPPVNDPLAAGLHSLANNSLQTVTINVGLGPAASSATVTGGPGGPFIGPNFLIAGNNNFANIARLQFFENGIFQGGVTVVPGQ
ncbi:MAG: hypothetical protein V3U29_05900, partial [Phycisphaeraceae bacterium]